MGITRHALDSGVVSAVDTGRAAWDRLCAVVAKRVCGVFVIARNADTFAGNRRTIEHFAEVRGAVARHAAVAVGGGAGKAGGVAGLADIEPRRLEVARSTRIIAPLVACAIKRICGIAGRDS